jgi:hypothetical protein
MSTRDKHSTCLIAVGFLVSAIGLAVNSHLLPLAGLSAIGVTVRHRKNRSVWGYLVLLVLALISPTLRPVSSLLIGTIPLMLAYLLDYIDEQTQKPVAPADEGLDAGTGQAEPGCR